jgi:phosphoribosylanthranilate isomerase
VRVRVKICCIRSLDEAWMAMRHGATALGLVSEMPSGPGVIPEERIAEIAGAVPAGVATFLLTARREVDEIVAQHSRCRTTTLQLVDRLERGTHADLRGALPGIGIVQVIHVTREESLNEALAVAPDVDALLLDSGQPDAAVKELGGTGRTHDWGLSRRIREAVDVPVYLAGGLTPDNVGEAVQRVGPFAADVCSGVRTDGGLDEEKLAAFVAGVGAA